MEEILSQEEIDAIFSGLKEGKSNLVEQPARAVAARGEPALSTVVPYDFRRPDRLSKEQLRALRVIYDYFGRNLSTTLSAYLRTFVQMSLVSINQLQYSEFLQYLPESTSYHSIAMAPLNGYCALEVGPSLAFPVVDLLVGGSGSQATPKRPLTDLEQDILDTIVRLILKEMREAWRPIIELDLAVDRRETKPQMLQLFPPTEIVVATGFEMKVGASASGMMNIGMPSLLLKSLKSKFNQHWSFRKQPTSAESVARVMRLLDTSRLSLSVEVRGTRITVDDLLHLNVGDVIRFDQELANPAVMTANEVPKFDVYVGVARDTRVAQIHALRPPEAKRAQPV